MHLGDGEVTETVFHHTVKSDLERMGISINCPLFCHVCRLGCGSHQQRGHSWLNLYSDDLSKTLKGDEQAWYICIQLTMQTFLG